MECYNTHKGESFFFLVAFYCSYLGLNDLLALLEKEGGNTGIKFVYKGVNEKKNKFQLVKPGAQLSIMGLCLYMLVMSLRGLKALPVVPNPCSGNCKCSPNNAH